MTLVQSIHDKWLLGKADMSTCVCVCVCVWEREREREREEETDGEFSDKDPSVGIYSTFFSVIDYLYNWTDANFNF